jgi:DNA-binding transcriptional LysR family regulator
MLRKYAYLLALARERHFGRAAQACNVSQPTLSNAIRQLEEDLNVPIVERGRAFQGFTDEGRTVLEYARRMLGEQEALVQSLRQGDLGLAGTVKLGVIPTALPAVAHVLAPFSERHPKARFSLRSMSSREIQRGLGAYELDAGITYVDNEPLVGVRSMPLYSERYFLLSRRTEALAGRTTIGWKDVASLRLCLLTPDMQNRRIAEGAFKRAGVAVTPEVETNSLMNLYTLVRKGPWASVVPGQLLTLARPDPDMVVLPLVEPQVTYVVGLVHMDRDPPSPLASALVDLIASQRLTVTIGEETAKALARDKIPYR